MSAAHHGRLDQSAEYSELVRILTSTRPGGALVIGGSGIGKTSLVRAALARPDVDAPVMALHCSPTLAEIPYGSLSPYLSALDRTDDAVQVIRELQVLLSEASNGTAPPIVVVEDAQFLDEESAFSLSMLVENAAIKLVAIGAGRIEGDSTLFSLAERGLLTTIVAQALDREGVRHIAEDMAGGPLGEAAVEIILAMTGGNPSFVTEYVNSSLSQGVLVQEAVSDRTAESTEPRWMIARLAPEPDEGLIELVREMHFLLPAGQQQALEILALGGRQSRTVLAACEGGEYRHLLESGVLVIDRDGMVCIRAEIYTNVLRHIIAPGRSAELHAQWFAHRKAAGGALHSHEVLWSLEVSVELASATVLEAVHQANQDLDYQLAWKICAVSGISEESDQGALAEAWTLIGLGRYYSARASLLRITRMTEDPRVLQDALNLLALCLMYLNGDVREIDGLDRIWHERAESWTDRSAVARIQNEHDLTTATMELWQRANTTGSSEALRAELRSLLEDPGLPATSRLVSTILLSDMYSVEGRTETALDLARRVMTGAGQSARLASHYRLFVLFRIGWNLLFSGRFAEMDEFMAVRRGTSARRILHEHGTTALLRGIGQMLKGQTGQARQTLSEAVAELRLRDPHQVLHLATIIAEFNAGPTEVKGAISITDVPFRPSSDSTPMRPADFTPGIVRPDERLLERAMLAGLQGEGRQELKAFPLIEREVLARSASRLDLGSEKAREISNRLFDISAEMEGPRAGLLTRVATPALANDAAALKALADNARGLGDMQLAAECLARAALLWSDAGDTRTCGALLRELIQLVNEHHLTPLPFVVEAMSLAELTAREEEIVDLARRGKNNAQIARALTVSQRTVEGHLYRVFTKLGISDRAELAELSLPMGTPPS